MASTDQRPLVVLSGPSREQLFDALRLHHEERVVEFRFKDLSDFYIHFLVESLTVQDSIGCTWRIVLKVKQDVDWPRLHRLEGVYNTRKREGEFVPVESV